MLLEVFITNGNPLDSTCKKGGATIVLSDLTEQEQSDLATAIAAMLVKDATNCGYLVDNSNAVEGMTFNLKHTSISSETVTCDKGGIIEDSDAVYTSLDNLLTSLIARI